MDRRQLARNVASGDRARARMQATGLTPSGHPLWIDPETGALRKGYPNYGKVLAEVRRRTRGAAHSKASRINITRPRPAPWDPPNDKPKMRKLYPKGTRAELLSAFPGRSWRAIQARAQSWHIFRTRPTLVPRGLALVDAILLEARSRNLTAIELDAQINGRGFFTRRHSRLSPSGWTKVLRALRMLGGALRARWSK